MGDVTSVGADRYVPTVPAGSAVPPAGPRADDGEDRLEERALTLMRRVDDRSGTALCVEALAWAAASAGQEERAARLSGAAEAVWRSIPAELPGPLAPHRAD